jgi:SAM-dependent methyltransferase
VKTLDLGCGGAKTPGAFGVDVHPLPGVDLVHNLDDRPWPLPAGEFDRIVASHVIEHVADPVAFMNEAHRVARPGATVEIVTPHFSNRCAFADPTHRRALSVRAFDFFTGSPPHTPGRLAVGFNYLFQHRFAYERLPGAAPYRLVGWELTFSRAFRLCGVAWFANRFLDFYEFYLAWRLPARDIRLTLQVDKDTPWT